SVLGTGRQRVERKSSASLAAVADRRQHLDRNVGQGQPDYHRSPYAGRAADQSRHSSHTDVEAQAASDDRSEACEALERDWNAGNIARFPAADVVLPRTRQVPQAVDIHIVLLIKQVSGLRA